MSGNFEFTMSLPIRNEWGNVERMRASLQDCFGAVFGDVDGCTALAMVAGELLENAIKYGAWADHLGTFRLRVWGDSEEAFVSVESPVAVPDQNVGRLRDALAWIKGFASSEDAYRAKLVELSTSDQSGLGSMGLVRIAFEGGCSIDATVHDGTLRVTAARKNR